MNKTETHMTQQASSALRGQALEEARQRLAPDWELVADRRLRRSYGFDDFASGLAFVNLVGRMADDVDHHPDIHLSWGKVVIEIWTHSAGGLTEKDFDFAARADELSSSYSTGAMS